MGHVVPTQVNKENPIEPGSLVLRYVPTPQFENSVVFAFTHKFKYVMGEPTKTYYKTYNLEIVGDILIKRGSDLVNTASWQREKINETIYNLPLSIGDNMLGGIALWRYAPCFTNWHHKAANHRSPMRVRSVTNSRADNDVMHREVIDYVRHFPESVSELTLANMINVAYSNRITQELQRLNEIEASLQQQRRLILNHSFNDTLRANALKTEKA